MLTKEDLIAIAEMLDQKLDEKLDEKLEPIKEGMTRLEERTERLEERTERIEERTERLEEQTRRLEERTERIEKQTERLEERTERIEERTKRLEERTTKIEITIENQVDRAIKLLGEGHESLRQTINERLVTKEQMEKDEARIFALEEIAKQHISQIEELQKKTG